MKPTVKELPTWRPPIPLVSSDPNYLGGAPRFNGTRVHVKTLFDYLAAGHPLIDFLNDFQGISREHAIAVLAEASARVAAAASAKAA
jgi:uncharacterized protein (DUF433 family)